MLIHDLDYSEKIDAESPVFGGKSTFYSFQQAYECKGTSNGKGLVCETSHTALPSRNSKPLSPDQIRGYLDLVEKSVRTGFFGRLWLNF